MMEAIHAHFLSGFHQAVAKGDGSRRIGAELKFPLVNTDGSAASLETVCDLWEFLQGRGWQPDVDDLTGQVVGARTPGEKNDTVASCETGFCKVEFSLAHVADLFALDDAVRGLLASLTDFCSAQGVHLLGCGIHPMTPPSERLLIKKGRTSVWDKVFGANRCLGPEDGDDVCLFTINAASHVHLSITPDEAIDAVNVLNGFAGAQIALTANSSVWKGQVDPTYRCVSEKLWDWWMPESDRIGVPAKPFDDLRDYVETVAEFRPVYVKRAGKPIVLTRYDSFGEYYGRGRAVGLDGEGREVSFVPEPQDIDLHNSCYWFNARLSRYYTIENRANDQQPPGDLLCIAALTLGLVSALAEGREVLGRFDWRDLRRARECACRKGLAGEINGLRLSDLSKLMLVLAEMGLHKRGLGEEEYLAPLLRRLADHRCPADDAVDLFCSGGIQSLIEARAV